MSMKIIKDGNGKAWETKEEAFKCLIERQLVDYALFQTTSGWVLKLTTEIAKKTLEVVKAPERRKYRKVRFQPRMDLSDPEQVVVAVNSEMLVFTRGLETMIPVPHLQVLDNAQHMTQIFNGEDVVKNGIIHRYAYSDLGEVSEAEYKAFLKAGTKLALDGF
jgi:hypothetical protein